VPVVDKTLLDGANGRIVYTHFPESKRPYTCSVCGGEIGTMKPRDRYVFLDIRDERGEPRSIDVCFKCVDAGYVPEKVVSIDWFSGSG